ncbi:hypothetical protein MZG95_25890, partial [Escherichia coli]|nr:hypothetical protein [Escherichia coli]
MNISSHWHLLVVFLCASLAHHKGSLSVVILNISVINVFDNHYHFAGPFRRSDRLRGGDLA